MNDIPLYVQSLIKSGYVIRSHFSFKKVELEDCEEIQFYILLSKVFAKLFIGITQPRDTSGHHERGHCRPGL